MRRIIVALGDTVRRAGVRAALRRIATALWHQATLTRWRLDLENWTPTAPPAAAEVDVRRGSVTELEALRRSPRRGEPLASEFYADRLDGVRWFYLARRHGAVAHISWIYGVGDRTPLVTLGPREVEVRRVYTVREHRGRRLFTAVLETMLADLRAAGIRVVYAHVEIRNYQSARAFAASGFRPVGTVRLTKRLGRSLVRFEPHGAAAESTTVAV